MAKQSYFEFLSGAHQLYDRYYDDWQLALKSYYGGVEYRRGRYLKEYAIDSATPSEVITTYELDNDGVQTGAYSSRIDRTSTPTENEQGDDYINNFYEEKLRNVCNFPYTRLYVSEYNSILFKQPPTRNLPDTPETDSFAMDCDGEGNSLTEFWSQVDTFTTTCGVVWVSCIKPTGSPYALWRMHKPTDVPNWEYRYTPSGELVLNKIVLKISSDPGYDIYQYITAETIDTVFMITDEDVDFEVPENSVFVQADNDEELNYYVISQPNELGYIPVRPVYQSNKIYNGVGHTPIFDIAQIQRSIYGDMGEIYSAVSYGAHGVNVVDEETAQLNDGALGAEPGSIIRVPAGLNGQPNYVYEFVAPPLDSISELRELVDQKIDKMNSVAMIRSEDLIRASRSGAQLEQYDSKLEAFIRKKATSLENAEYHMWKIWFDWLDKPIPEDFSITYSRVFSKRGLEQEIKELQQLMAVYEEYQTKFVGEGDSDQFTEELKTGLQSRLMQLLTSSYSENSL